MEEECFSRLQKYFLSCGLSPFGATFALEYLRTHSVVTSTTPTVIEKSPMVRVIRHLIKQINPPTSSSIPASLSPFQRGCPVLYEGLTSQAFWDTSSFPWVEIFESNFEQIKNEFLALHKSSFEGFQVHSPDNLVIMLDLFTIIFFVPSAHSPTEPQLPRPPLHL